MELSNDKISNNRLFNENDMSKHLNNKNFVVESSKFIKSEDNVKTESYLMSFQESIKKNIKITDETSTTDLIEGTSSDISNEGPESHELASEFIYHCKEQVLGFSEINFKNIESKVLDLIDLSEDLDINFDMLDDEFIENLSLIDRKIKEGRFEGDLDFLKSLITDLVIFACCEPNITKFNGQKVTRNSIEVLCPEMLGKIIKSLSRADPIDLDENAYLSHLKEKEYDNCSLSQKMVLINLANFDSSMRDDLRGDKIFNLMMKNENLHQWMLACSGSLEQNYLNTCEGSSFCQEMITRSAVLPEAIFLTKHLIEKIEEKNSYVNNFTMQEYTNKQLKQIKDEIAKLEDDLLKVLESDEKFSEEQMHQLTLNWSKSMQKLGLLVDPSSPAHPTEKVIKNAWYVSAIVMTPTVLFKHVFKYEDNPPSLAMRAKGVNAKTLQKMIFPKMKVFLKPTKFLSIEDSDVLKNIKSVNDSEKQKVLIENLWKGVHRVGGSGIDLGWHALHLKAIKHKGEKIFLISDPMTDRYQVKTSAEMLVYLKKNNVSFRGLVEDKTRE